MISLYKTITNHRSLVVELTKREFMGRYKGSIGGVAWAFAQPLFLLCVYTITFGYILKTRWGGQTDTAEYALILLAGLIIFNLFSECITKSCTLITNNPNFVKKILFPLELLPIVNITTLFIHALIGSAIWFLGYFVLFGFPKTSAIFFPLILLSMLPVLFGISMLLSAIGVFVRDITQTTGMLNHALLFLTPIFYNIDIAPPVLQNILKLNPLTFIVEEFRKVLFFGGIPNFKGLFIYFLLTTFFAWCSLIFFRRLRPTFADMV